MLQYPRKLQYVEFSNSEEGGLRNQPISVWSKDGQSIILEVGFYFKLLPERLADLYFLYKDNYIHVIEDVAMNGALPQLCPLLSLTLEAPGVDALFPVSRHGSPRFSVA